MYLDYNATTPLKAAVADAVNSAQRELWGNTSSGHGIGRAASQALEKAREEVAAMLDRPAKEISFTSGATESNAWAFWGLQHPDRPVRLVSSVEHPSVGVWGTHQIRVDGQGRILLDELDRLLREHQGRTALVSVMAANNETGVIQPVAEVAELSRNYGVPFHCDATQAPGKIDLDLSGADLISLSAHKFGGPKGVGALASRVPLDSFLQGGGQERGRRAGTVNLPGVIGMGVAARLAGTQDPEARDQLEACGVSLGATVVSGDAPRLPNTSCLLFPVPGDLLVMALDLAGLYCSSGSACASGAAGPGHVLKAMGFQGSAVRFSIGADSQVPEAIETLQRVYPKVKDACGS